MWKAHLNKLMIHISLELMSIKEKEFLWNKKEEFGWLSCMSAHPVKFNDIEYRTCEALFQARRFKDFPEIQEEISLCKSPMGAKMIARRNRVLLNRGIKRDEAPSDLPFMKECLQLKLEQHPDLKTDLIKIGDAEIIEDCTTHDRESARFWGAVNKSGAWVGDNNFGKLWIEIREELK
jgi:predicted NAD-dependent protein-ADP-ribosyltransferase YbiA (DUF1768 family)